MIPFCIDKKFKSLNETIYESLSNTLYHHIVKPDIIDENKSKIEYESIKFYKGSIKDGFNLLFIIIKNLSPQIGGKGDDPIKLVENFKMEQGDSLLSFYTRYMKINNNIELQKDSTGQKNRLVGKFIEIIFESDNINIKFKISIIHDYWLYFKIDFSKIIYKEFN